MNDPRKTPKITEGEMDIRERIADLISDHCEEGEGCGKIECSKCPPMLRTADKILELMMTVLSRS